MYYKGQKYESSFRETDKGKAMNSEFGGAVSLESNY